MDGREATPLRQRPVVLLAVDGPQNESKGDDDASEWLPPRKAYDCRYVAKQITIKTKYALWVTPAERVRWRNAQDLLVTRTRTDTFIYLLVYFAALAVDIWLVFVLPKGSWQDHAGLLLGIIGIFAFATGFLNAAGVDSDRESVPPLDSLTSPNLFEFVAANLRLVAIMQFFAVALLYGRDPWTGWASD